MTLVRIEVHAATFREQLRRASSLVPHVFDLLFQPLDNVADAIR
jgi:hypothetical protein